MARLMRLFQILIDDFFPPTYIFSFLTVPEFLITTLGCDLQRDVELTRRNSSGNPTESQV